MLMQASIARGKGGGDQFSTGLSSALHSPPPTVSVSVGVDDRGER